MERSLPGLSPDCMHVLRWLHGHLSPARLAHTLGVTQVMGELAEVYNLDREVALLTGLAHDCAKDLPPGQMLVLAQETGLSLGQPYEAEPIYLHAPIGSVVACRELGIHDPAILDAIATHSYVENGSDFHAPLAWCLRFADMLEPGRTWKALQTRLRPPAYEGKLRAGALVALSWLVMFYPQMGIPIHPDLAQNTVWIAQHQ